MTAISVVAQAQAAYILTDGALYDDDGRVRAICSKTLIAEQARLALAPSGRCTSVDVARALEAAGAETQAEIMAVLPAFAVTRRGEQAAAGRIEPDLQFFVALWSDRHDEAQVWMLSTCEMPHWGRYRIGTWLRIDAMVGTARPLAQVLDRPCADARTIDMVTDGRSIILDQRSTRWPDGRFYVGGHGELVTVTHAGVDQQRLITFPDRVGELINPARLA